MVLSESVMKNVKIIFCSAIKQDPSAPSVKKMKSEDDELDKVIEKQNKEYFKLRDSLQASTTKPTWLGILRANKQNIPEGNAEVCRPPIALMTANENTVN